MVPCVAMALQNLPESSSGAGGAVGVEVADIKDGLLQRAARLKGSRIKFAYNTSVRK